MKPLADHDLLQAYLDGDLPAADLAALERRLCAEAPLADLLVRLSREEAILTEWAQMQAVEAALAGETGVTPAEVPSALLPRRGGWTRALVLAGSLAAALLLALLLPAEPGPAVPVAAAKSPAYAKLVDTQGDVFVVSLRGAPVLAIRGQTLKPGQSLTTRGEGSSAVVSLADARRVELGTDTTVRLLGGLPTATDTTTKLYLEEGSVAPDVAGPTTQERPMLLATPHGDFLIPAEARVSITSDARGARVETEKGSSQVVNQRDGRAIDVPTGWFAFVPAKVGQRVAAERLPPTVTQARLLLREDSVPFQAADFSPEGSLVALGCADGTLRLVNLATQQLEIAPLKTGKGGIRAVAYAANGQLLAATADERQVRLYAAPTGQEQGTLRNFKGAISCLAFSADGAFLATSSHGKNPEIKLWNVAAQLELHHFPGHGNGISALAFAPDGRTLATAGRDGAVKLWDLTERKERLTLTAHSGAVGTLAFSPDGSLLATAGRDKTLRLWDTATGQEVRQLHAAGDSRALAFSPDGKRLAAADANVRLWNLETGLPLVIFRGHRNGVCALRFSPDGKQLSTAGWDRTLRVWDVPAEQPR